MQKLLIIQNSHEGLGIIAHVLKERKINYDLVRLNDGDKFPSPIAYKAVIILGGPDSANDRSEKMLTELMRVREILDNNIPVLGICLGCQILVKLTGGKVSSSKEPEIGLRDQSGDFFQIHLTENGKNDPLFEDINESFTVFELHGEVIDITSNIKLLGVGSFIKNQIVKVADKSYGVLCHFEIVPNELDNWFLVDSMFNAIDKEKLIEDFRLIKEEYHQTGKKLFTNFLVIAGL